MAGAKLGLSVGWPFPPTLSRRVAPATTSWTKTSPVPLASLGTRLSASDSKATSRPSPLIDGATLGPSPGVPWGPTLASTVVWATRSRTNTSSSPLVVAGREVRRRRAEGHVAAVGADGRAVAVAVALLARRRQADPLGGAGPAVVDEDVLDAVGVAGHQARAGRGEGDVAAVAADGRREARPVGLPAVDGQRDEARADPASAAFRRRRRPGRPVGSSPSIRPAATSRPASIFALLRCATLRPPGGSRRRTLLLSRPASRGGSRNWQLCPFRSRRYHRRWPEIADGRAPLCPRTGDG